MLELPAAIQYLVGKSRSGVPVEEQEIGLYTSPPVTPGAVNVFGMVKQIAHWLQNEWMAHKARYETEPEWTRWASRDAANAVAGGRDAKDTRNIDNLDRIIIEIFTQPDFVGALLPELGDGSEEQEAVKAAFRFVAGGQVRLVSR